MNIQQARRKAYGYAAEALRQFVERGGIDEELLEKDSPTGKPILPSQHRANYAMLHQACISVRKELEERSKKP